MVLTTWKLLRNDPWMSESLENNRWSSGSVSYSFSMNSDGSKWITIINFMLWHDLRLKHFIHHFWGSFSAICFNCHFNEKKVLFKFPRLEFRFKSCLELHVHFKGLMCIRMHKLHAECQIPADAHNWCQIVFSFNIPKFFRNTEWQNSYRNFSAHKVSL